MKFIRGYIHSYNEASLIVHAVRLGIIEPIKERLSNADRENIKSGCIFVFIEDDSGIKRWTDGKIWSPSKILGHFLLYKEVPKHLSKSAIKKRNANAVKRERVISIHTQMQNDEFSLFKKTISIKHETKSYHIISYFQPIFDKRGILEFPFFRSLNSTLVNHPDLMSDHHVEALKLRNVNLYTKYGLLKFEKGNILPEIDRNAMERMTCYILSNRLRIDRSVYRKR
ncbi:hypothetical protein VCUG_02323 [Vavraia culicis subsp. floridensis]|uniref:Gluconate transport-inducing protein n=1 Tax=Vavraia culicis (isolate floridensis) TaxID=948595 RepID=L2GS24_VAVCU|nr:uncharacterized protein VCUG_02323 [Vavraia culicis subsp. floridensis]ELA46187.1 hypothetical protein VCUG_02323 [Vavraia culicis subsp. floridensis]